MSASQNTNFDPIALTRALIRRPSVTPVDAGAMDLLEKTLSTLGFSCRRMKFGEVENLYARLGEERPNFCFAGHTDVVPAGDDEAWSAPPFEATLRDGEIVGRGAVDMKGAIAAFTAAVADRIAKKGPPNGSISFLITGDEEGPAIDGTKKVLEALAADGETIDHCLVGEPTSVGVVGDTIKTGRRGSLNGVVRVKGRQGHVAYPERAENPIPALMEFLARLMARALDEGHPPFQPSNLEVTTIDVGNAVENVIPAEASARFNLRFNPLHDGEALSRWIQAERGAVAVRFQGTIELAIRVSGEAFLTEEGPFTELLAEAIEAETGTRPEFSAGGGTSDARFIKNYAPVAEMGLVGATMHKVDERASTDDIELLTRIYARVIEGYFKEFGSPAG